MNRNTCRPEADLVHLVRDGLLGDLLQEHGRKYRAYRHRVPMLIPFARRRTKGGAPPESRPARSA